MNRKTANTIFSFQSSEIEPGKVKVTLAVTVQKRVWARWVRWCAALLISILVVLNVPGVEHLIR